jgi:L-asparaginase
MTSPTATPAAADVTVLSLGGTIFMAQDTHGNAARPDADTAAALLERVAADGAGSATADGAARDTGGHVTHRSIANVGSSSIRPGHLRQVLEAAKEAVRDGAGGIVLTQGTDTLEESAFLLNRYWDQPAPLVVTGAMRPANAPGADGPANLRDAVQVARSPRARDLGVLAVFDGEVHLADRVLKTSTRSAGGFGSVPSGPVGIVDGTEVRMLHRPVGPRIPALAGPLPDVLPRVPVLALGIGDDAALLDALPAGTLDGLVVAGTGMGHVPERAVARLAALVAADVPVLISTRVPSGGTSTHHYDYPGSETDLLRHGCRMAGLLRPAQARLLLQALLADGADGTRIDAALEPLAS